MRPNTFISYSRHCIGFVDDLAHRLEKREFNVWLDYRSLIPGRPWLDQIHKGLDEADLLLLVVSPESLASSAVELEWRHFLERGKRIILVIFQTTPLPPELASLEWIDFRGGYNSALKRLFRLIETPVAPVKPAPQSGFKAPAIVWLAALFSVVNAIYSIFAFWTFFIPWVLVPLPARIFKRSFNLPQVQTALWTLSIALFFSLGLAFELGIANENADFDYNNYFSLYNFVLFFLFIQIFLVPLNSIALALMLRSPGMQRWGKPEASLPKFANVYHPNIPQPEPVRFYIDHAPEDGVIASELAAELKKYGHVPADGFDSAEDVLVLLSRFKSDSEADPEHQVVYPILIQRTKISEKLSKMQWIDFRKGVRNLEAIAQLLPQPQKMLAALGVRPTSGAESAMPGMVQSLVDYLIIMGMVEVGSFISYMLELMSLNIAMIFEDHATRVSGVILLLFVCMIVSGGLIYFMAQALIQRRGRFASPGIFLLGLGGVFAIFTAQGFLGDILDTLFREYGIVSEALFAAVPFVLIVFGGFIVGIAALFRRKDLHRWFPSKEKHHPH